MFNDNLKEKIKKTRPSIVAVGFHPEPNKITIVGSGFCVSDDGKIITSAHLWQQIKEEYKQNLKAAVMVEQIKENFERYDWIPLELLKLDYNNDLALLQLKGDFGKLIKKIELGDSDQVEVGQDAYYIGFPYAAQLVNEGFGLSLIANRTMVSTIKYDGVDEQHPRNWIFLDTISNPGNSGGPVIDAETNKIIGVMSISFRTPSHKYKDLDIREPMHIAGAKPINLAKALMT